jgi:hypothetical protein
MEYLDDTGYPTDEFLDYVKYSTVTRYSAFSFFKEIESYWAYGAWIWEDGMDFQGSPVKLVSISTWGWSGNESIIDAMQHNFILWSLFWVQHRRGGHYQFEIPWQQQN